MAALASGLGYALYYVAIPRFTAGTSATVHLSVPITASVGGVLFLAELLCIHLAIAYSGRAERYILIFHSDRRT